MDACPCVRLIMLLSLLSVTLVFTLAGRVHNTRLRLRHGGNHVGGRCSRVEEEEEERRIRKGEKLVLSMLPPR